MTIKRAKTTHPRRDDLALDIPHYRIFGLLLVMFSNHIQGSPGPPTVEFHSSTIYFSPSVSSSSPASHSLPVLSLVPSLPSFDWDDSSKGNSVDYPAEYRNQFPHFPQSKKSLRRRDIGQNERSIRTSVSSATSEFYIPFIMAEMLPAAMNTRHPAIITPTNCPSDHLPDYVGICRRMFHRYTINYGSHLAGIRRPSISPPNFFWPTRRIIPTFTKNRKRPPTLLEVVKKASSLRGSSGRSLPEPSNKQSGSSSGEVFKDEGQSFGDSFGTDLRSLFSQTTAVPFITTTPDNDD